MFEALRGVSLVEQGWASSLDDPTRFSEAVRVAFRPAEIPLEALVAIHLHTHSCTADHALRRKYRSAVYCFSESQRERVAGILADLQADFERPIVTEAVRFGAFRQNSERYRGYYRKHAGNQFCERYISPKLALLRGRFAGHARGEAPAAPRPT